MRFNFFATTLPNCGREVKDGVEPLTGLQRPLSTIETDLESLDCVISNPKSYPITILPNRPTSFYDTSINGKNFNRQLSGGRSRTLATLASSNRRLRRRAVGKNGECNLQQKNLKGRSVRYMQDMYTTLVDTQWRWTLLTFALSFILSWLFFAMLWWLIAYTHGDLEEQHLPDGQEESGWKPCVSEIDGFTACFLFSIETQHTIGYGARTTSTECPEAVLLMCLQSIYGVMSSAFMAGFVFAKMIRGKQRAQTLLFSKRAVMGQRNGQLALMFRVGDMRKSHIIGASVRAQLIRMRTNKAGELVPQFTELKVGGELGSSDLFFFWPEIIAHVIDESSPLYNMCATDLLHEKFEIIAVLEGTVESTGLSTQARTSYLSTEILWGHRFADMISYNKELQSYEIDFARFGVTVQVDTPLCSARELSEIHKFKEGFSTPPAAPSAYTELSLGSMRSSNGSFQTPATSPTRRYVWQLSTPVQTNGRSPNRSPPAEH